MTEPTEMQSGAFIQFIGLNPIEAKGGKSIIELPVTENLLNRSHTVHGGALFTLADAGMARAMRSLVGEKKYAATAGATIHFFSPAKADILVCKAEVIHQGNHSATVEAAIYANDVLIAKAMGNFVVSEKRFVEKLKDE